MAGKFITFEGGEGSGEVSEDVHDGVYDVGYLSRVGVLIRE